MNNYQDEHIQYAYEEAFGVEQNPINREFGAEQKMLEPTVEQLITDCVNSGGGQSNIKIEFVLTELDVLQMVFDKVVDRKMGTCYFKPTKNPKPFSLEIGPSLSAGNQRGVMSSGCLSKTMKVVSKHGRTVCCSMCITSEMGGMNPIVLNSTPPTDTSVSKPYIFYDTYIDNYGSVPVEIIDLTINPNSDVASDNECISGVKSSRDSTEITGEITIRDEGNLKDCLKTRPQPVLNFCFKKEDKNNDEHLMTLKLYGTSLNKLTSEYPKSNRRVFKLRGVFMKVAVQNPAVL